MQYEYHLGDKVYIGASEYEILSVDDERVMLYDYDMPLFNKEFSRTEFDRKVRENPMNEHLIVKEEPAEERNEKEPEPLVPAWEQKKKAKALTCTLMCLWQTVTPLILEKMRLKRLVKRNASAEILWRYSFLKMSGRKQICHS